MNSNFIIPLAALLMNNLTWGYVLYSFLAETSRFYLILAMIAIAVITMILIRIVTLMYKKKADQVEFRTAYIASITAGLIFGVLMQLATLGIDWLKVNVHLTLGKT